MMNTRIVLLLTIILSLQALLITEKTYASKFSPPGLYDVEHLTLDNGMDVILKPRTGAHTFSMRVWVGVGSQDFPCERQEVPHFLEHLLFTGTSNYTEAELEHMVADHGGYWNAATDVEATTYQMDIYSRYADFAVNMLYEILTDSIISHENVEISRDIIHREAGGEPSAVRLWFREQGFGISGTVKAVRQLVPGTNLVCEQLVTASDITREEIIDTFERYYVPANMALIVVGDFDKKKILALIAETFGSIAAKTMPEKTMPSDVEPSAYEAVTGTFAPLLGNDANVGIMYRLPSYWHDDNYPRMIIEEYLYYKVSEIIRMERGLAYAPGTWSYTTGQFGLFGLSADVNIDDIHDVQSLLINEVEQLAKHPMTEEVLEKYKLKLLLQSVQGYESNKQFADYYLSQYVLFRKDRLFENNEDKIEAVTVGDIDRVVKEYLSEDKAVTIYETPTLTYTQLYLLLSALVLVLTLSAIVLYMRTRARIKNK